MLLQCEVKLLHSADCMNGPGAALSQQHRVSMLPQRVNQLRDAADHMHVGMHRSKLVVIHAASQKVSTTTAQH